MNCIKHLLTGQSIKIIIFALLFNPTTGVSKPLSADEELKLLEKCSKEAKEQLLEKKKFTGKLESFVWGDLFHSEVSDKNGEHENFVSNNDDACFLAQHKKDLLEIEYDLMCQSLPDNAGYVPVNVITQIKTINTDYKTWLRQTGGNNEKCEKLVEKYTREP